jgi:hypothetical protein
MVAEEVPPSLGPPRVGVKRSREQPHQTAAHRLELRPALDADPRDKHHRPTMEKQGRGPRQAIITSSSSYPLTSHAPSLLPASSNKQRPQPSRHAPSHNGSTHEMFLMAPRISVVAQTPVLR